MRVIENFQVIGIVSLGNYKYKQYFDLIYNSGKPDLLRFLIENGADLTIVKADGIFGTRKDWEEVK